MEQLNANQDLGRKSPNLAIHVMEAYGLWCSAQTLNKEARFVAAPIFPYIPGAHTGSARNPAHRFVFASTVPEVDADKREGYTRRILDLLRKPSNQWDADDRAAAGRAAEYGVHKPRGADHDAHSEQTPGPKQVVIRDEFDRRLWGLPARPRLTAPHAPRAC